jgi:S-adenosylmethionine:tRNA ribosyltransferase-isomerase
MHVRAFDYALEAESIAQSPLDARDSARLLVVPRKGELRHRTVRDLPELLPSGALIVLNDTRVIPARLLGHKQGSGGKVEILLLRRLTSPSYPDVADGIQLWEALGRASKGLPVGSAVECPPLRLRVVRSSDGKAGGAPAGKAHGLIEVAVEAVGMSVSEAMAQVGHVPLPPYIRRPDDARDRGRYQTVFARVDGAVAAPTAGLHLTESLMLRARACGLLFASVTLHVGLGTFQPVTAEDLDDHAMHAESYLVPPETADAIREARMRSAPVVAIGTTVVRALESAADPDELGMVQPARSTTRLLIQPGYQFRVVDRLLTNFHVPRSTLLALVCAFGETQKVLSAYRTAQHEGYRFLSYGDAMLLERNNP